MTMIIRILNHLPASGGTLISKSLVAAGTIVLNEVYPFYRRSSDEFSPSGFVDVALSSATQILTKSQIKNALEINFIHQMKAMQKISKLTNVPFFVRPWNYPQWSNDTPVMRDDVCDLIEKTGEDFDISTVVTLRNPIDNFLSFSNNNWSQYQNHPNGFDEFCKRYV